MFFLNSISVTSGQWEVDNEWLFAMGSRSRLKTSPPQAVLEPGNTRLVLLRHWGSLFVKEIWTRFRKK